MLRPHELTSASVYANQVYIEPATHMHIDTHLPGVCDSSRHRSCMHACHAFTMPVCLILACLSSLNNGALHINCSLMHVSTQLATACVALPDPTTSGRLTRLVGTS